MRILRKEFAGIKVYWIIIVLVLSIFAITMGSKFDRELAHALFQENSKFSNIFAILGKAPAYSLFGFSGVLYFISEKNCPKSWRKILAYVACFLIPIGFGALYGYDDFIGAMDNKILAIFLGILTVALVDVGLFFLFKDVKYDIALKAALFIFFTGVVLFLAFFGLKYAGLRPRFKYIVAMDVDYYKNWWDFDRSLLESFTYEDLSSLPSGHTGFAAASIMFTLLSTFNEKTKKFSWIFALVSLVFTLVVGFSRMLDGSHYLSDVGWGMTISYIIVFVFAVCFYSSKENEGESEDAIENEKE